MAASPISTSMRRSRRRPPLPSPRPRPRSPRRRAPGRALTTAQVLAMQRGAGNQAVARMLDARADRRAAGAAGHGARARRGGRVHDRDPRRGLRGDEDRGRQVELGQGLAATQGRGPVRAGQQRRRHAGEHDRRPEHRQQGHQGRGRARGEDLGRRHGALDRPQGGHRDGDVRRRRQEARDLVRRRREARDEVRLAQGRGRGQGDRDLDRVGEDPRDVRGRDRAVGRPGGRGQGHARRDADDRQGQDHRHGQGRGQLGQGRHRDRQARRARRRARARCAPSAPRPARR